MKIHLLILFITLFSITNAQTPSFQWANSAGGINNDEGTSIATDVNGNVFVTGRFQSPSITFGSTTLNNAGGFDFFIAKYDANGNVLWAKSVGGTSDEVGESLATDANGNVIVTGYFYSYSITFGTTTLTNSSTASDIFVVKYDANGNLLWAKSEGGTGYEEGKGIGTDADGNIFLAGHFSSPSVSFGAFTLTNTSPPAGEIFLVKYDSNGNALWAVIGGQSPLTEFLGSLAVDADGNAYITGSFYDSSIWFGSFNLTNSSSSKSDLYVVKYDPNGNVLWARSEGGSDNDSGTGICADANGNVLLTGYFKSPSISFGATFLMNVGTSTGSLNAFVVKYDSNGNPQWARGFGGNESEITSGIATDANGNVYVTGNFHSSSVAFGTSLLTKTGSTYYSDIFVAKYDPSGNNVWAKGVGGTDSEMGFGIATDANADIFVTGYFYSPSIAFGATILTNTGGSLFVAKLGNITAGIDELSSNSTIQLFPNPASSLVTLQAEDELNDATLTIYNTMGQIVKEVRNISGQTVLLSLDDLAHGQYIIELISKDKVVKDKLIIVEN